MLPGGLGGSVREGWRKGGGGELGFQLPAFTPSLALKIGPIAALSGGGCVGEELDT